MIANPFHSSLPINYLGFTLCFLSILKTHSQYSFLCLPFSHYQKLMQFLCYILTVKDKEKLFNFQELLSFQGALYNFSIISAISSYTSVRNSRFYPIFNKLASDSLRLHHQLSNSSASVEELRNSQFFPLLPVLLTTLQSTWEPTHLQFSVGQIQLMHKILKIGKRQGKAFKFHCVQQQGHAKSPLCVKKLQSWAPITQDSWYSCSHWNKALEPVQVALLGHKYSTRFSVPTLAEASSASGSWKQEQASGSNPRAEWGWGHCWKSQSWSSTLLPFHC